MPASKYTTLTFRGSPGDARALLTLHLRRETDFAHLPSTWRPTAPGDSDLSRELARTHPVGVTCPNGHSFFLSASVHAIHPDGRVTPSVVCSDAARGCPFHEWVVLDGWAE